MYSSLYYEVAQNDTRRFQMKRKPTKKPHLNQSDLSSYRQWSLRFVWNKTYIANGTLSRPKFHYKFFKFYCCLHISIINHRTLAFPHFEDLTNSLRELCVHDMKPMEINESSSQSVNTYFNVMPMKVGPVFHWPRDRYCCICSRLVIETLLCTLWVSHSELIIARYQERCSTYCIIQLCLRPNSSVFLITTNCDYSLASG